MIELKHNQLVFSFPELLDELHPLVAEYAEAAISRILAEDRKPVIRRYLADRPAVLADWPKVLGDLSDCQIRDAFYSKVREAMPRSIELSIGFQRTLRIPDDGKVHPLPPGFGGFPLRHVDDHEATVPPTWLERGGVIMPMFQAEALWLDFDGSYPAAVKIGTGKINALTGEEWRGGLHGKPQDYLTVPSQPWLDGFAVAEGTIRQFVAAPLGDGTTVEEQLTGKATSGGIQIQVYPMKPQYYFDRLLRLSIPTSLSQLLPDLIQPLFAMDFCAGGPMERLCEDMGLGMGMGMGGRMRQEIYKDLHGLAAWDQDRSSRCFVHLCNSMRWREITGENPPHPPVTAHEYRVAGLPWFDYYRDDLPSLEGSKILAGLKSLGENKSATGKTGNGKTNAGIISCGPKKRPNQVREWSD
jgi:hypothetical protein